MHAKNSLSIASGHEGWKYALVGVLPILIARILDVITVACLRGVHARYDPFLAYATSSLTRGSMAGRLCVNPF